MDSSLHALLLALLLTGVLATIQPTTAQNSPQDFVRAHNRARRSVGVGPVTWDPDLESYAQDYASRQTGDCRDLTHSGGEYGENIFWGRGRRYTARDAVDAWVSEKQHYNYRRNSCAPGKQCGHYTQVVWANSVRIGCARVKCDGGAIYIICEYSPPGNIQGQWPYGSGPTDFYAVV